MMMDEASKDEPAPSFEVVMLSSFFWDVDQGISDFEMKTVVGVVLQEENPGQKE